MPKGKEDEEEEEEEEEEDEEAEEDDEEEEEEEEEDEDDEDDEDDETTADLLPDTTFSPIKPCNNNSSSAKTNGHVLLGSEGLKPNPVTPAPPSPTEPLLCPLVESELSYTDRDNSISSGYEMYNGEQAEPGLTNGSSEQHRVTLPYFPDLPLDPEPGNQISVGGVDTGASPSPNSPTADRSRTVSSSSTGDTPKGNEGTSFSLISHRITDL